MTEFRILGPVEAVVGGESLDIGRAKQRAVLAALLVDIDSAVSVETLVDRVWDDRPPPEARRAVQAHLSRIRAVLARVTQLSGEPVDLRRQAGFVRLTRGEQKGIRTGMRDHSAATALRHSLAASARKIRSVDRETRWR